MFCQSCFVSHTSVQQSCKTQQKDSIKLTYARKELKETNEPTLGGKWGRKTDLS
jgi:hypothetical protein